MRDIIRFCVQGWGFWKGWYWVLKFSYACFGIRVGRYWLSKWWPKESAALEAGWSRTLSGIAQSLYSRILEDSDHPDFTFEYARNVTKGVQALSRLSGVPIIVSLPKDPHRLKP